MREKQVQAGVNTGYYGEWAKCRNLSFEEQKSLIESGRPFVLRLRSQGNPENYIKTEDMLRGRMEMPENNMDVVLIKSDGIPPYAFAHAVDDHLMRTNLVVRSDEWIASYPPILKSSRLWDLSPQVRSHLAHYEAGRGQQEKAQQEKGP